MVERYSSTGEFIEYLPSLVTARLHSQKTFYAGGTFKDGQGDKAYLVVGGWGVSDWWGLEFATEVLFQDAKAWVPGPQVPLPDYRPWTSTPTGYNLASDQLLMVYGSERDYDGYRYSEVFQFSPLYESAP